MPLIARSIATTTVALLIAISVLLLPATAEYPMFHNDPQRTGNVSGYAPVTGNLFWKTQLSSTGDGYIGGGASIVDGRVYVSNWPMYIEGGDLGLFCLNETDGTVLWSNVLDGYGGVSTPAIECGRVFTGATYYSGDLYCINASDGTTIWNRMIEPYPGHCGVASSPLIHNGMVYVVSSSDGRLHAFDFDGVEQWNYSASGSSDNYMSAATDGSKLFFGGGNAMNCVDIATQTEEWTFGGLGYQVTTTPAVENGVVYFATGKNEKKLYAVDIATGNEVWNRYLYGSLSSPAISGDRIYIGDKEAKMNCINATDGSMIWNRTLGGKCDSSPVVAGGMVYTAANYEAGTIYCFDADCGTLVWSYDTNQYNMAQPSVSDGILFVGSDTGYLYAFRDQPINGDLNNDRKVTAADAVIALQMAVGAVPAVDEADMNGDNKVTSLDALVILQVAAGSIHA